MTSKAQRLNQERFSRTAEQFATSRVIQHSSQVDSLLRLADPSRDDLLLDVACGPGRLLATFAPRVRRAVGVDLTPEMLAIARRQPVGGGAGPLGLVRGEGERLPFRDGAFTLVVTTLAIHHYGDPGRVIAEMVRVCRSGGRIGVGDLVGPSDDAKRALANEIERLRDPSHVEALSPEGLAGLLTSYDLLITGRASGSLARELHEWCRVAGTPSHVVARVRAMLLDSQPGDLAGMNPVLVGGELRFRHDWVNLVCRKP